MVDILNGKQAVLGEEELVVVLIGARINRWWLLPLAAPILNRMGAMQRELLADPESGLIAIQSLGIGSDVQYWRSLDHLLAYVKDSDHEHVPTARRFYQKIFKNQAIGVWHEVFVVPKGHYEGLYINMPRHGLGKVHPHVLPQGALRTTLGRLSPELSARHHAG